MKYQQLENLECGWKYDYLLKKHQEGESVTRYIDSSEIDMAILELKQLKNSPILVLDWIQKHMNPELDKKLKQTIRARRKRHFNSEQQHTKKKSIDLTFYVWQKLADLAKSRGITLSEMITQLIEEAEEKDRYEKEVSLIKTDLLSLLNKPK